jgi:hypothetical protein
MKTPGSFKFNIHSFVDVITNSSTTIFTYSDSSIEPAKKLINAFVALMGYGKTADDMFYMGVFPNLIEVYERAEDDEDFEEELKHIKEMEYDQMKAYFDRLVEDVCKGKIERPSWIDGVKGYDDFDIETWIHIIPKEEKYKEVAEALEKFLYSTTQEASYN